MREETLFMAIPTAPRNSDGIRDIKVHGSGGVHSWALQPG